MTDQLIDQATPGTGNGQNYYLNLTDNLQAADAGIITQNVFPSPRSVFGSLIIAPGTERVLGPVSNYTDTNSGLLENTTYFRLPTFSRATLAKQVEPEDRLVPNSPYRKFTVVNPGYFFDYDLPPYDMLRFSLEGEGIPGLPALLSTDPPPDQRELRVTYLWQNNFARDANGNPLDANGNTNIAFDPTITDPDQVRRQSRVGSPEPDVVKVDYSTRSLMAITIGARVYDSGSGEAQVIQLADKIQVNNVGR
ncbi:MAG: hypothetical protein H7Z41_12300 [Cytophagales bacterium]|nr:hypothetical protein [Armatimonadota bacterium]